MNSDIEPVLAMTLPIAAQTRLTRLLNDALLHLPSNRERTQVNIRQAILLVQGAAPSSRRAGGLASWQMRRVEAFVQANLGGEVNLHTAAEITRISSSHFSRAFKASFGQPFTQYVMARRVELARDLLRDTDRAICEIALSCGLSDQSHLTRLFQRFFGQPPSAWRRAYSALRAVA